MKDDYLQPVGSASGLRCSITLWSRNMIDILLIEDNAGDVRLAQEALRETRIAHSVRVARDGEEAVTLLNGDESGYRPDLIILDLNLPRKDGREVLKEVKGHPDLQDIPVVVLTTSTSEDDIRIAYQLRANCFITKGSDWDRSCEVIRSIHGFWSKTVTLPRSSITSAGRD